jgi:hypothetical protein
MSSDKFAIPIVKFGDNFPYPSPKSITYYLNGLFTELSFH